MSYSPTVDTIINGLGREGVLDTPDTATLLILAIADQIDADVDAVAKALGVDTLAYESVSLSASLAAQNDAWDNANASEGGL